MSPRTTAIGTTPAYPNIKSMKSQNLSKSQKSLLDIVRQLDMQKKCGPQDKPPSTMMSISGKRKLNVTLEPPTSGSFRPQTMQGVRALSNLKTRQETTSRYGQPITTEPAMKDMEVLLPNSFGGPGAVKINPRFRQYQVSRMVNHYFK